MTTSEREYAPSAILAQQALNIYDRKGEFAVLPFMMNNIKPTHEAKPDWLERGCCLMDDGSDIVHHGGSYVFGWHDPEQQQAGGCYGTSSMP